MKNIIILSVLSVALVACTSDNDASDNNNQSTTSKNSVQLTDAQLKNADIAIGKIEQKNISAILKLTGKVDVTPSNVVSISFPLGGYLKTSKLLPGMKVKKGEVIAVMEDPQIIQLQQDYLTSKVKLSLVEQEFNRQSELNKSKATSDKLFQQAQSEYLSQKILVNALFQKLVLIGINPSGLNENNISSSVNLRSPINGFISNVNVNVGKYVNPVDVLFEIVNPDDIHFVLNVFEKDINKLELGQSLKAYSNNNPNKKYDAEIYLIGKELSESRNVEVHCYIKNSDKSLVPGMFMNAEIEVSTNNSLVLPTDAIVSFENKQFIYKVNGKGEFEMLEVTIGVIENGYSEIIIENPDNFRNQEFVIKGAYNLLMKMKNTSDE